MATTKFSSIKARRMRLTAVDACGAPILGAGSTIVTGGFVSVAASAQVEAGDEMVVKNAWGEFCVNDKGDDRVKRWDLTMEFCEVDPQLLSLLTGGRVFTQSTTPVGGTFGEQVGQDFALELWTKIAGGACVEGGGGSANSWIYWVFPHIRGGVIGDLSFENGPLSMSVKASTTGAGADWGTGPYTPALLPLAMDSDEHIGYVITSATPPADSDGAQALVIPSTTATAGIPGTWGPPDSTPPADVAALIAGDPVTVTASPTTSWTVGQYVQTQAAGVGGRAHWNGTAWVSGAKP